MATNKRKTTTAIVAGVTAVALLLGGTFAWTSISQQAKNEAAGIVNVGGRLHDDFDGTNKDVYVENFTDPLDGGQPIYARVKLTEYMEVGQDAGGTDDGDGKNEAVPVVENTDINDPDTWTTHVPSESCAVCATEGTCKIHDHWTWTMGGDNGDGSTVFMPTFNKDKDSLAADINGTYAGTNPDDKIYYDDYATYVTETGATVNVTEGTVDGTAVTIPDGATGANALTEANTDVTTVTGTAYYDDDTDTDENDHANGTGVRTETETHTAKQTSTAKVITMEDWLADPIPGNFWVYDTDGWAYWANPIMPGEATGLLLDGIVMEKNPGEKCYYAINVVGQFATVNDWEYFDENQDSQFDGTDNAKTLLETAAKNVATVTVTNVSGETLLTPGESYTFSANVYVDGVAKYAATDFDWSVLNTDLTAAKSTIEAGDDDIATLTVADGETAKNLIVVAKSKDANYLGALGMTSIAVDIKDFKIAIKTEAVDGEDESYIDNTSIDSSLTDGETAELVLNNGDTAITEGVTWRMELVDGGQDDTNTTLQDGTAIDENTGVLTIASDETTWQSNNYSYETYHVIRVTAAVDGADMASRTFVISGTGAYVSTFDFYEVGTNTMVSPYNLAVGTTYDVRGTLFNQTLYTDISNIITASMDPIYVDGLTFTIEGGEGAVVENGQFTATAAGTYNVFAEGYLENWGECSLYQYSVTVTDGSDSSDTSSN